MFCVNFLISYSIMSSIMIYSFQHLNNNFNKVYMGLFMAGLMGLAEMVIMGNPLNGNQNVYFYVFLAITLLSFLAIRKQIFIGDDQFIRSMIEHHSAAVLMAEKIREKTKNPTLQKFANDMIISQSKEINLMNQWL